jgi:GNAT superfamily N-acetyltransferase
VVSVRRGGVEDAAALRAIRLEALADTPEAFGSTYAETATWDDGRWREVAGSWTFFLAFEDGAAVGMATGGYHDQHPGTWLFGMYVTPRLRGTGVADALVASVVAWARAEGAGELFLHVTELVPRARAFYEKVGFSDTGDVATLRRDANVAMITMVRRLD